MAYQTIHAEVVHANKPNIKEIIIPPLKITPTFFYDHGKHLTLEDSQRFFAALVKAGYLSSDQYLVDDPRQSEWRNVARDSLPGVVPFYDSLIADASGTSELLNLAYAMHEISDYALDEVFAFMKTMEV